MTETTDPAAALTEIRERYRTSFTTLPGFSTSPDTPWAHVNSADDVPLLVAALEAVLALHAEAIARTKPELPDIHGCPACGDLWPCPTYRAITSALTGQERSDG